MIRKNKGGNMGRKRPSDYYQAGLKYLVKVRGLKSQKEIVGATGISKSTISKMVNGDMVGTADAQAAIAEALGKTWSEIVDIGKAVASLEGPVAFSPPPDPAPVSTDLAELLRMARYVLENGDEDVAASLKSEIVGHHGEAISKGIKTSGHPGGRTSKVVAGR